MLPHDPLDVHPTIALKQPPKEPQAPSAECASRNGCAPPPVSVDDAGIGANTCIPSPKHLVRRNIFFGSSQREGSLIFFPWCLDINTKENHLKHQGISGPLRTQRNTGKPVENPENTKEFPRLQKTKENQNSKEKKIRVVSNLVVAIFMQKRPFALFCALFRSFSPFHLRSFALICVFLQMTAFRTTAFGNCGFLSAPPHRDQTPSEGLLEGFS